MKPSDAAPVLETYAKLAPIYDRRWASYVAATMRETLARLEVRPGERVLDVGCGTGALLAALARSVPDASLAGTDPSAEMLAVARDRLGDAIPLSQGFAESLAFPDRSCDVVVSTNALHYFRDPARALAEMARVLRPDGRLVITDWCDDYLACRILDQWLRRFDRAHFRTYGATRCRAILEGAGFAAVRVEWYKIDWLWGLMTATARNRGERRA